MLHVMSEAASIHGARQRAGADVVVTVPVVTSNRPTGLRLLVAIEEAGDEEHQRDHEREFGVGQCVQAQVHDAVRHPGRTSDKPDPRGSSHC